ncbi:MAG: DUF481 domain-containing protein [Verrucomicrobiota bacterium]
MKILGREYSRAVLLTLAIFTVSLSVGLADSRTRNDLLKEIESLKKENEALRGQLSGRPVTAKPLTPQAKMEQLTDLNKVKWKRDISLGANLSRGNTDSFLLNLKAKATRESELDKLQLRVEGSLGETEEETTAQKALGRLQYNREIGDRWYWLALGEGLYDDQLGINYRFTIGPGIGYKFYETDKFSMSLEAGPVLVLEELNDSSLDTSLRGRVTHHIEYQFNDAIKMYHEAGFLQNAQDLEDWNASFELGLESRLMEHLSLRFSLENLYDNKPASDKQEYDLLSTSSIVIDF